MMKNEVSRNHENRIRSIECRAVPSTQVVAFGVLLWLATLGCAAMGPVPGTPPRFVLPDVSAQRTTLSSAPVLMPDWEFLTPLGPIEISFYDADDDSTLHVTGPYRVVFWSEDRVDLVGQFNSGLGGPAALTVWHRGEQIWAYLRMEETEYLTRIE